MAATWYEQGIEQGRELAFQQGREQGHRQALAIVLEERFGALDPQVNDQLRSMLPDRIRDLLHRVLRAQSLEDLGLGGDLPAQ